MCIDYLKKIGGLCFYNSSVNGDSFIKENYVLLVWFCAFSFPTGMVFFVINNMLIIPFFCGAYFSPEGGLVGLLYVFLHAVPLAIFYYFLFLYKKKYLKYMELYKNYPKWKVFYFMLFIAIGMFFPLVIFDLFRDSWGV